MKRSGQLAIANWSWREPPSIYSGANPPEENQHGYTSLVTTNVSKCLCFFFFSVDHKLQVAFTTWYPLNQTYQLSVLNKLKLQTETWPFGYSFCMTYNLKSSLISKLKLNSAITHKLMGLKWKPIYHSIC